MEDPNQFKKYQSHSDSDSDQESSNSSNSQDGIFGDDTSGPKIKIADPKPIPIKIQRPTVIINTFYEPANHSNSAKSESSHHSQKNVQSGPSAYRQGNYNPQRGNFKRGYNNGNRNNQANHNKEHYKYQEGQNERYRKDEGNQRNQRQNGQNYCHGQNYYRDNRYERYERQQKMQQKNYQQRKQGRTNRQTQSRQEYHTQSRFRQNNQNQRIQYHNQTDRNQNHFRYQYENNNNQLPDQQRRTNHRGNPHQQPHQQQNPFNKPQNHSKNQSESDWEKQIQNNQKNQNSVKNSQTNSQSNSKKSTQIYHQKNQSKRASSKNSQSYALSNRNSSNQSRWKEKQSFKYAEKQQRKPQKPKEPEVKPSKFIEKPQIPLINQHQKYEIPQKSNQRKVEQPPTKLQSKQSTILSQPKQNQSASLNQAHSHITIQISSNYQTKQKQKIDQSSIRQPSDNEDSGNHDESIVHKDKGYDESKSFEKSSFECHDVQIEDNSLHLIINSDQNDMSTYVEENSLLRAMSYPSTVHEQLLKNKVNGNSLGIDLIPKKEEFKPEKVESSSSQDESIFTKKDLQILQKMYNFLSEEGQCIFVEVRITTGSVSHFEIKELSSKIFNFESQELEKLKKHKFIILKEFEKSVPRDQEPQIQNRRPEDKIQQKPSKIILAQIKNPLYLLEHKSKLLEEFKSFEERETIEKIEENEKEFKKSEKLINIQQVTLKCSSCNKKKSFFYNGPIAHQCSPQCPNFFRFNIVSVSIC